jgi:hypothetical protein
VALDSEFSEAEPDSLFGVWFTAGFDSDCDGDHEDCRGIFEGEPARSDGQGGWLCALCGDA